LLNSFAFDPGSVRVESVDRRAAAHGGRIAHRTLSSEVNGSLRDGRRNRRRAHAMASAHRYRGSFKPDPRRGGMTKSSSQLPGVQCDQLAAPSYRRLHKNAMVDGPATGTPSQRIVRGVDLDPEAVRRGPPDLADPADFGAPPRSSTGTCHTRGRPPT
jgi:hypothetical protein